MLISKLLYQHLSGRRKEQKRLLCGLALLWRYGKTAG